MQPIDDIFSESSAIAAADSSMAAPVLQMPAGIRSGALQADLFVDSGRPNLSSLDPRAERLATTDSLRHEIRNAGLVKQEGNTPKDFHEVQRAAAVDEALKAARRKAQATFFPDVAEEPGLCPQTHASAQPSTCGGAMAGSDASYGGLTAGHGTSGGGSMGMEMRCAMPMCGSNGLIGGGTMSRIGVQAIAMPQMGMPQMGMQQMDMPQMGMPQMDMPQMDMPQIGIAQIGMPQMGMPQMSMPQMGMPQMGMQPMQMQQPVSMQAQTLMDGTLPASRGQRGCMPSVAGPSLVSVGGSQQQQQLEEERRQQQVDSWKPPSRWM